MKSLFPKQKRRILALFVLVFFGVFSPVFAQHESHDPIEPDSAHHQAEETPNVSEVIIEHVKDSHVWHFTESVVLPLPVIVYTKEDGLKIFSSGNFFEHHHPVPYGDYTLEHEHIYYKGNPVLDLSITKNVAMLFINTALMLFVFVTAGRAYAKRRGLAPKGIQSFMEPVILFVKDEIVAPNIGPKYWKFLPYLLTLFFFIFFGNLLGLLPGAANLTGNIAVTACLAILTFIITNVNGNGSYWGHIFWTPGVPHWMRVIILPVELIGVFTKPFALTVRLFVAITAGHIVLLALTSLTFIFQNWFVGVGTSLVNIFISLIELLVAGIQAYVFTMFTSLYIGQAIAEHEHHDEGHH
ncbi:MAG TPA: F0F1 ATP synthase subunit A [Cyclobacteriaceae bacterium]|nr:F0F1 ATP synthase subunit A [Cyclobacteriaceae bacterium]